MSDLSRLLDDVYRSGPAQPAAPAPVPAAPEAPPTVPVDEAPPADEAPLPWESSTTIEEAFADWVPGPTADAPKAEHDLFADVDPEPELTGDSSTVLQHVFADDQDDLGSLADLVQPALAPPAPESEPEPELGLGLEPEPTQAFVMDEEPEPEVAPTPIAGPAPAAMAEVAAMGQPSPAPSPAGRHMSFSAELDDAPAAPTKLAYEPPATLAEALLEAPDAPPADLVPEEDEWPLAGLAPTAPAAAVEPEALTALRTTWRREDDDLLPRSRAGRGRR